MKILIASVFTVLALVSTAPVAFASHSVPFTGSSTGTFAFTSSTTVALTGNGHYHPLGKTMFSAAATITGPAACGGFIATEKDTYRAANGDAVFTTATNTLCPTSSPGVFNTVGTFKVTGGTGRFEDASGSGSLHALVTFTSATTGTFIGSTHGTISFEGEGEED